MSRSKKSVLTLAAEQEVLTQQQSSDIPELSFDPVENTEVFPGLVEPDVKKDEVNLSDLITAIATDTGNLKYALKQDIGELKAGLVAIVASQTSLGMRFTPTKWVGATDVYDPITKRAISNLPVAYAKGDDETNTVKYLAATMSKIIQIATGKFVFVKPV